MTKSEEAIFESALKDTELIELLKAKEAKLRKEREECTEKIKDNPYSLDEATLQVHRKRIILDDAIHHVVGLLEFLTKEK